MLDYTDAKLAEEVAFGGGYGRAASYLLTVDEGIRSAIVTEAHIRSNVIGERYADAVWSVVDGVKRSGTAYPFSYTETNRAMLARERAAREVTGRFVPESFTSVWK
jgi:hypothetical protein